MTQKYLFGDTDLAAARLGVLADAFAASSTAFLAEKAGAAPAKLRLAVDLGCGPGYTTHMLADALQCEQVVGLDNSEHFIHLATKTATDKVSFYQHDVTAAPFPVSPCDLIYARFLLTHQGDPAALVARWATQLSVGGRLLLEETESIDISEAVFGEYIRIVVAMLSAAGHDLYVGPKLDATPSPAGLVRLASRVACIAVTNDQAAKMFSMNIQTWKHNNFVRNNYSPAAIQKLQDSLTELAARPTKQTGIKWKLRQLVFEREK